MVVQVVDDHVLSSRGRFLLPHRQSNALPGPQGHRVPTPLSLGQPPGGCRRSSRQCWLENEHRGSGLAVLGQGGASAAAPASCGFPWAGLVPPDGRARRGKALGQVGLRQIGRPAPSSSSSNNLLCDLAKPSPATSGRVRFQEADTSPAVCGRNGFTIESGPAKISRKAGKCCSRPALELLSSRTHHLACSPAPLGTQEGGPRPWSVGRGCRHCLSSPPKPRS